MKCWGGVQCRCREWRCRINPEFNVSVLVGFTNSGVPPGLSEEPVMNADSPLKGWEMRCGSDVSPACGGSRSWLDSSDTAKLAFSWSPWCGGFNKACLIQALNSHPAFLPYSNLLRSLLNHFTRKGQIWKDSHCQTHLSVFWLAKYFTSFFTL